MAAASVKRITQRRGPERSRRAPRDRGRAEGQHCGPERERSARHHDGAADNTTERPAARQSSRRHDGAARHHDGAAQHHDRAATDGAARHHDRAAQHHHRAPGPPDSAAATTTERPGTTTERSARATCGRPRMDRPAVSNGAACSTPSSDDSASVAARWEVVAACAVTPCPRTADGAPGRRPGRLSPSPLPAPERRCRPRGRDGGRSGGVAGAGRLASRGLGRALALLALAHAELAGDLAAALQLELAIADLAGDPAVVVHHEAAAHGEVAVVDPADLGLLDLAAADEAGRGLISRVRVAFIVTSTWPSTTSQSQAVISPSSWMPLPTISRLPIWPSSAS